MKIFILGSRLTGGGAERVTTVLANGLADLGHTVYLYCYKEGATYPVQDNVKLMPYNRNKYHLRKRYNVFFKIRYMVKQLKKYRPDVVIGIMGENTMVGRVAVNLSGLKIPVVYSDHFSLERPKGKLTMVEKIYKFHLSKYCAAYTVLTQADKDFVENKLKNVYVMPNPLCIPPLNNVSTVKEKIILAIGRLDAWYYKGFDILIDAWGKIAYKYHDWKLVIVGAGTQKSISYLKDLMGQTNAEKQIEIHSFTPNIIEYYQKAEIFVLSSRYEGFGLVLLEAMSRGCACIACDYKGRQAEIIQDGIDGLLCTVDNTKLLSSKIGFLITNDSMRKLLQNNAIVASEKFSPQKYISKWDVVLKDIVNANQ